jgi:hypothetical protein
MTTISFRFCCPHCRARIKAPVQMVGQGRDCPGCGHGFVIPPPSREDSGPVLVPVETETGCTLSVVYRRSA